MVLPIAVVMGVLPRAVLTSQGVLYLLWCSLAKWAEATRWQYGKHVSIAEMIKLSSGVRPSVCLCVRNSYLEILPSGTFFPREKNPAERHHNLQKWPILLPYARPPLGFFWQYLSQKSSYKTGA
jgi:hypothetical protein